MPALYAALVVVMVWLLRDGAKAVSRCLTGFVGWLEYLEYRAREARIARNRARAIADMPDYRAQLTELWNRPEYVAARKRIVAEIDAEEEAERRRMVEWAEDGGDHFGKDRAA